MKTILHLERKYTSKTETFIINQVNSITEFNVVVACIMHLNNFECDRQIIAINKNRMTKIATKYLMHSDSKNLMAMLGDYKPSAIHVHYLVDAIFYRSFVKNYNIPKIVSCYGYDVSSFPKRLFGMAKLLIKPIFKDYDYFIAMSEDMKRDLIGLGCPERKIIVHYYGTAVKDFIYEERVYEYKDKVKILSVGTLEEKKAQLQVIEALSILKRVYGLSNFEYHIVGDGPYRKKIEKRARELNVYKNTIFYDYIPHYSQRLKDIYKSADIFTLPSITTRTGDKEGIPGTIVEAMASGLPVLSTFHGGIPYIISNMEDGILINEGDIEKMAQYLKKLIEDVELRTKLGVNARSKAKKKLDLCSGTKELESIYKKVIEKSK